MKVFKLEWEQDGFQPHDPDARESVGYFVAENDDAAVRFVSEYHIQSERYLTGTVRHWVWTEIGPALELLPATGKA